MKLRRKALFSIMLCIALMLGAATLVQAESGVQYIERSWDGSKVVSTTKSCASYAKVADINLSSSWYVADRDQTFGSSDRLKVTANTVNLIIRNGVTLTCQDGIHVPAGKTLNIYFEPGESGKLIALGDTNYTAAIGGDDGQSGGNVTIHGGYVKADGYNNNKGEDGAGIGGGNKGSGGTVTIYSGTVEAYGSNYGAGIGSGDADKSGVNGGNVRIYGGNVTAKGGCDGAGIGGGEGAGGATVDIYGGTVKASGGTKDSSDSGAGIGSGDDDGYSVSAGTVRIHGGDVTAQGGPDGAGIGGGNEVNGGTVEVTGGKVKATGGNCGAGIGGGEEGSGGKTFIKYAEVTATGGEDAMGIGRGDDGGDNNSLTLGDYMVLYGGNSENPTDKISTSQRYRYMIARFSYPYKFKTSNFHLQESDGYRVGFRFADVILKKGGREVGRTRVEQPSKYSANSFTVYATDYADSICVEYYSVVGGDWAVHKIYQSVEGELTSQGSLRRSGILSLYVLLIDYTTDDLLDPVYQAPTGKNGLIYTGSPQELANAGSVTMGGRMEYALGNNGSEAPAKDWSTNIPSAEDADTYYVWYRVTSGKGRSGTEARCIPVTITGPKKEVVSYQEGRWDTGKKEVVYTKKTAKCMPVNTETETDLKESWYFVRGDVNYESGALNVVSDTVNIVLCDKSRLSCLDGIHVPEGKTLNIYSESLGADMGKLTTNAKGSLEAGIGGGYKETGGTINIFGGEVSASGGEGAAGIGGGRYAAGGNINIYGGTVNAYSGVVSYHGGAGIGGGRDGAGGKINIYGGTVNAKGGAQGAGIGGGENGTGGTVSIYGGDVKGNGGDNGAGIGGGRCAAGGATNIYGGTVHVQGGSTGGAGIGGGYRAAAGTISITGGSIDANAGMAAAGIGCGEKGEGGTIEIKGGTISANGSSNGAGIGSGDEAQVDKIKISGGKVTAYGGKNAAGIGSGKSSFEHEGGDIEISGGDIFASGGWGAAGIGGGRYTPGRIISISGGAINAYGGSVDNFGGAGIGGGDGAAGGDIEIYGTAIIKEARGGVHAAGIGGGTRANGGNISISNGTVRAVGSFDAAGIGGGDYADGGNITIKGGEISATGGQGGAGIGGGVEAASGTIRIYKGTVTASGGDTGGAGIGTGALGDRTNCDVVINGGTVIAHGGAGYSWVKSTDERFYTHDGAGIGAGGIQTVAAKSDSSETGWGKERTFTQSKFNGSVTINGGEVTADRIGASEGDISRKNGKVIFNGGTVSVRSTPVGAGEIVFADDVRVSGATADERENRCKEGDSFKVEKCPHDNLEYTDVDESGHSWKCRDCMTSGEETEAHSYGEPVWNWDESETAANAGFTCVKCGHTENRQAEQVQIDPEAEDPEADPQQNDPDQADPQQTDEGIMKPAALTAESDDTETEDIVAVEFEGELYTDERNQREYFIDLDDCENGSVEVPESAHVGYTVNMAVKPDEHYHVVGVYMNGKALEVTDGTCSFRMPKGNVKISAVFEVDTVQLTWVSRDYVYDYENDEYTDETVDTVVYTEEVAYGTEGPLPGAEEFAALYGYCGLKSWEVTKGDNTTKMKPGDLAVADADVTLTAIWREHDFTYSVSDDDATITASCSHDDCALPGGEISLTIRKPALKVYGDTDKGHEANASLTLNGLDAFIEYCRDLQAFMEYGTEVDAYRKYDKVIEYYKEHPEEYKEYADEIDAYIKELEKLADLVDGWADEYIKYYKATKDSDGVYIKKGSALKAPPTAAGDYVAELEIEDIHKTIFVGYTIDKADPLYDVPEGMSAEFGQKLGEVNFAKDPDGTWEWNEPEKSVTKLDNFRSMATFTPKDPKNYNTLTDVKVPVKVTVTTETNIADKALVDAAKDAVNAARKNPTKETVEAAQAALAKIVTQNQKAMYGQSEFGKDQAAVAEAKKALEEAAKKEANERAEAAKKAVKTVTVNTKTVSAKTLSGAIAKAGGSNKYVTTIVLGKNVKNISKGAFKGFKSTKTLVVQSKKLTKKSVKGSLKGSKVKTVKVKVGSKKTNKKYVKKYKKIFTKKNAGRKARVK